MNTLLYSMGEEADDVLSSTNITEEERRVYATVMGKFEGFFKVRKNVIFERARFNRRNQLDGETSEKYITELYRQIDSCKYGDMKEELLRDRLVVGILDHELSEKLQLEADLTLEAAKKSIRQKEAVKEQYKMLQANVAAEPTLDEVSKFGGKWKPQTNRVGLRVRPMAQCVQDVVDPHTTKERDAQLPMWCALPARRDDTLKHTASLGTSPEPLPMK